MDLVFLQKLAVSPPQKKVFCLIKCERFSLEGIEDDRECLIGNLRLFRLVAIDTALTSAFLSVTRFRRRGPSFAGNINVGSTSKGSHRKVGSLGFGSYFL